MPDLWFVAGLALGVVLMGFVTIGSFDRGVQSVRRDSWNAELLARKRAFLSSRSRQVLIAPFVADLVTVPIAANITPSEITLAVPAAERRTRIRRDLRNVHAHIAL